jgi:hypothetical protein
MHQFQTSHLNNTIDLILSEVTDRKSPDKLDQQKQTLKTVNGVERP